MLFFVSFHTRRALRVTPPQQARDSREVGLPAFSSLGAKGSHQLPLSSLKAGKKSVNSQTKNSNCLGRTQTVLEKLQLGRGRPGRRPPPTFSPGPLQNSHRHKPSASHMGAFQLHSHLVPPPQQPASCPWSRCEEPTLNLEPPSWSGFPLRQARVPHQGSAILLPFHAPCPTVPTLQHHHQDMGLHRRGSNYGKNSPKLHLPQKCPLVLPVPSCPFIFSLSLVGLCRGSANVFCEGPDSKYFSLCKLHGPCCNRADMHVRKQPQTIRNGTAWLCSNTTLLWTPTSEFHIISTCRDLFP